MSATVTEYAATLEELRSNKEQWAAFESGGHCVTLAGPGSGKTKVLTMKMARLLRGEINPPRGLACVTYNNECARELERRLASIGVGDAANTFVGTLHGFCLRHILRPFAQVAQMDIPSPIRVAAEATQARVLREAMRKVGLTAQRFKTDMDRFRRTAIDRIHGQDGWEIGDNGLTDVTVEYERRLRAEGQVDFEDIVILSMRAVEQSEVVRQCLKAQFPVLLVDEYQDLGVPLHRMVIALGFKAGVRIFAVGDPDQSIYGFTGARPDLLCELAERSDVQKVDLRTNYRSGRRIIAASALALGQKRHYRAQRGDQGIVEFKLCPQGLGQQVEYVTQNLIPALVKKGDTHGEIAVLYPTSTEGDVAVTGFEAARIPFARIDGGCGYRRTPLIRLIEDLAAWCCGGWRVGTPSLATMLARWKSCLGPVSEGQLRSARKSLVRFLFASRDPSQATSAWLQRFDLEVFAPHVTGPHGEEDERNAFAELIDATSEGGLAGQDVNTFAGKATTDRVCLMNLHTSKGSEFNSVILIGMDDGRMPLYLANTPAEIAEQRRLFFVGVSRAIREVHLVFSGWTENQWGRRFNDGPSRFLVDIQRGLALLRDEDA